MYYVFTPRSLLQSAAGAGGYGGRRGGGWQAGNKPGGGGSPATVGSSMDECVLHHTGISLCH